MHHGHPGHTQIHVCNQNAEIVKMNYVNRMHVSGLLHASRESGRAPSDHMAALEPCRSGTAVRAWFAAGVCVRASCEAMTE